MIKTDLTELERDLARRIKEERRRLAAGARRRGAASPKTPTRRRGDGVLGGPGRGGGGTAPGAADHRDRPGAGIALATRRRQGTSTAGVLGGRRRGEEADGIERTTGEADADEADADDDGAGGAGAGGAGRRARRGESGVRVKFARDGKMRLDVAAWRSGRLRHRARSPPRAPRTAPPRRRRARSCPRASGRTARMAASASSAVARITTSRAARGGPGGCATRGPLQCRKVFETTRPGDRPRRSCAARWTTSRGQDREPGGVQTHQCGDRRFVSVDPSQRIMRTYQTLRQIA